MLNVVHPLLISKPERGRCCVGLALVLVLGVALANAVVGLVLEVGWKDVMVLEDGAGNCRRSTSTWSRGEASVHVSEAADMLMLAALRIACQCHLWRNCQDHFSGQDSKANGHHHVDNCVPEGILQEQGHLAPSSQP